MTDKEIKELEEHLKQIKAAKREVLETVEEWLHNLPTQPHIEYNMQGEKRIRPRSLQVCDYDAMIFEWEYVRSAIEKGQPIGSKI